MDAGRGISSGDRRRFGPSYCRQYRRPIELLDQWILEEYQASSNEAEILHRGQIQHCVFLSSSPGDRTGTGTQSFNTTTKWRDAEADNGGAALAAEACRGVRMGFLATL